MTIYHSEVLKMSNVILATRTKQAIDEALERDQGAKFRTILGKVLPHIGDGLLHYC